MRGNFFGWAGLAGMLLTIPSSAHAALSCLPIILPSGVISPIVDDTCAADHTGTSPIGTKVSDTLTQPFTLVGSGITTTGNYREEVFKEIGGTLDFYIQFAVTSTAATSEVSQVNTGNFTGFTTDAGTISTIQLLGAGTVIPSIATRSASGDTIGYNYLNPVGPSGVGTTSFTLAISTNATLDQASNIGLIGGGGGTQTVAGFEPLASTAVPEPVTIIPIGLMFAASAFFLRLGSKFKT